MKRNIILVIAFFLFVKLPAIGQTNPDSVKQSYNQYITSQLLLDPPNYNEAINKAVYLIGIYPNDVDAYLLAGSIFEKRNLPGDTTSANTYYLKALSLITSPAYKAENEFGKVSFNRGVKQGVIVSYSNVERAKNLFISSLASNEKQEEILEMSGLIYELFADDLSAISCIERIIKFDPNHSRYYKKLAELYYRTGNLKSAVSNYELALSTNDPIFSNSAERNSIFLLLSKTYIDLREFTKAHEKLKQFSPLNSEDSVSFENESSICYLEKKDTANAIACIEKALTFSNTNDSELVYRLISIYASLGKPDKMLEAYAVGESRGLASCKSWLSAYDSISSKVNVVYFELYSENTNADLKKNKLFELGNLYHVCGDYYSCIKVMNDYIQFNNINKDSALAYIAASYFAVGKYAVALNYVSKVYEINSSLDLAKVIEIYSLYYSNRYEEALEKLNKYNAPGGILDPILINQLRGQITKIKNFN